MSGRNSGSATTRIDIRQDSNVGIADRIELHGDMTRRDRVGRGGRRQRRCAWRSGPLLDAIRVVVVRRRTAARLFVVASVLLVVVRPVGFWIIERRQWWCSDDVLAKVAVVVRFGCATAATAMLVFVISSLCEKEIRI
jgi:hypothetical protein